MVILDQVYIGCESVGRKIDSSFYHVFGLGMQINPSKFVVRVSPMAVRV